MQKVWDQIITNPLQKAHNDEIKVVLHIVLRDMVMRRMQELNKESRQQKKQTILAKLELELKMMQAQTLQPVQEQTILEELEVQTMCENSLLASFLL